MTETRIRPRRSYQGLITLCLCCLLVAVVYSRHHDPLAFVVMGERFAAGNPQGNVGYDGQFAYYIALDPANAPVHIDDPPYRYQRILYPMLARLMALGQPALVPWALVFINIVSLSLGAELVGRLVAWHGHSPYFALVLPLWLGQIDGLAMWGLMCFPVGMIWALAKPNITVWALLARRQWVIWAAVLGMFSLLVWGLWPVRLLAARSMIYQHPSAMGWGNLGWPVLVLGLLLFPFSGRDPLRLMASGALLMPFVMPYHFLMLLPALGKVCGWRRWLLWGLAWVTLVATAIDGIPKYIAWSFPVAVWIMVSPHPFDGHRAIVDRARTMFKQFTVA